MKGLQSIISASFALGATTVLGNILPRASSLTSVTIKGNAFYAGDNRFYIRGVDYQPGIYPHFVFD